MSKKIDQLDPATNSEAKNDSYLFAQADPVNGLAKKVTIAQAKEVFATKNYLYTATGSEGSSLTISALAGYDILLVTRESGVLYEVGSSPDSSQYTWDDITIGLGTDANAGERFLILFRTY